MGHKNIPSGRFVLRLRPNLHEALRKRAFQLGISMNDLCQSYIEQGLVMSGAEQDSQNRILEKAKKLYSEMLLGILLFGSHARGDTHDASDIDLLIVLRTGIPIKRDLYQDWNQEFSDGVSVHLSHLPADAESAGSLWLECALDGKVLYDPSGAVKRMLFSIKNRITSGKVIRKTTHGQGYWVNL